MPDWVKEMVESGRETFYENKDGVRTYYDPSTSSEKKLTLDDKEINLNLSKNGGNIVKRDWSASLIDLGDSILNVEFHSALQPILNPIDSSMGQIINDGMDLLDAGTYKGMV